MLVIRTGLSQHEIHKASQPATPERLVLRKFHVKVHEPHSAYLVTLCSTGSITTSKVDRRDDKRHPVSAGSPFQRNIATKGEVWF
jgi:hypothetical protein